MSHSTVTDILVAMASGVPLNLSRGSVRARDLRAALLGGIDHDPLGLTLENGRVEGRLDLRNIHIDAPLTFTNCTFTDTLDITGATLSELAICSGSKLACLIGNHVKIRGDLNLSGTHVFGHEGSSASASATSAIWLCEAHIGGRLLLAGTRIEPDEPSGLVRALQADRLSLAGTARLIEGFVAVGEVRMIGAQIEGSLDLTSATLSAQAVALDLGEANIGGSLFLVKPASKAGGGPNISGRVEMGNAKIRGRLMMQDLRVAHPKTDESRYSYVQHGGLESVAISAPGLQVDGDFSMRSSAIIGAVDLRNAEIGGDLEIHQSRLSNPGKTALALASADLGAQFILASHLSSARDDSCDERTSAVEGSVYAPGLRVAGSLDVRDVTFTKPFPSKDRGPISMVLSHGKINGPAHLSRVKAEGAIAGINLHVEGNLMLKSIAARGLYLDNAVIEQVLLIEDFSLKSKDSVASLERVTARSGARLGWADRNGTVSLAGAELGNLTINSCAWPATYVLTGLRFTALSDTASAGQAWKTSNLNQWLSKQKNLDPAVYSELAKSLHSEGAPEAAELILIEGLRQRRKSLSMPRRIFGRMHDWFVGYGYRPIRAGALLLGLIVAVWTFMSLASVQSALRAEDQAGRLFSTSTTLSPAESPNLTATGAVRAFNPVLFAIDSVVPLLDLGQRSTWYPDTSTSTGQVMQYGLAAANISGWVLSSVLLLSMSSLARRLN